MDDYNNVLEELHIGEITSCDFNINFVLALGLSDRTVRVLEWKRGVGFVDKLYSPLIHHKYAVSIVKFSPRGNLLVTSSMDGTAVLIEIYTGTKIFTMVQYNTSNIKYCNFVNTTALLTADEDGMLCFWDIVHYKQIRRCRLHEEDYSLRTIDVTSDYEYLLSIDSGDLLRLWYIGEFVNDAPCCLLQKKNIEDDVLCCIFSPIKNIIGGDALKQIYTTAICNGTNFINFWEMTIERCDNFNCSITPLQTLQNDIDVINITFDPTGQYLVSTGFDGTIKLWNVHDKNCLKILKKHKKYVTCTAFSKNSTLLATGSIDKKLIIWDLGRKLTMDSELLVPCVVSSHFTQVNTTSYHNTRTDDGKMYTEFSVVQKLNSSGVINTVKFNTNFLVLGGGAKVVELWSKQPNKTEFALKDTQKEHNFSINALDVSHTGDKIISCSTDGLTHWDININLTYTLTTPSMGAIRTCKFSGDAKFIAAGGDDQRVYLWDANKLEFIREMQRHENAITAVAFSPDTESLVSVCCGGSIILQSLNHNSAERVVNNAHDLGVICCDFSAALYHDDDGKANPTRMYLLATGGNDSLIKLWKVTQSGIKLSATLTGHGGSINDVKFSNTTPLLLASCSNDTTVRITDIETNHCIHVLNHHQSPVTTCSFSKDSTLLATGSLDKNVYITKLTCKKTQNLQKSNRNPNLLLEKWTSSDIVNWFLDIGCIDLADKINLIKLRGVDLFNKNIQTIVMNLENEKLQKKFIQKIKLLKQLMSFPSAAAPQNAPHKFLCPITHQIMKEPVICVDGYTYDRASIEEWFLGGKLISPITKESLNTTNLLPYSALKINIYKFLEEKLNKN